MENEKMERAWIYLGGVFDSKAIVEIVKLNPGLSLRIKFKNLPMNFLIELKKFLGYGSLYVTNRKTPMLSISKKNEVLHLLLNLEGRVILKQLLVNYLLENFNFNGKDSSSFNLEIFRDIKSSGNSFAFEGSLVF